MIKLSNLPKIVDRRKKRLGRGVGSGRGAKSGRGTTRHQRAREAIPISFEGGQNRIIKRIPLLRGKGKNKSLREKFLVISVGSLNQIPQGETVTVETLVKHGLIKKTDRDGKKVKIVDGGQIDRSLIIKLPITKMAKQTIEKIGGHVVSI